jgi:hypothetical protein
MSTKKGNTFYSKKRNWIQKLSQTIIFIQQNIKVYIFNRLEILDSVTSYEGV